MNDNRNKAEIPSAQILFHRVPHIEQMRDPLSSEWNRALVQNLGIHELTELIDFSQMNTIFQNFLEVVGLPVAIVDFDARVLASSNWQRICMEFHRVNQDTLARCWESDLNLSRQMQEGKPYAIYRCINGLTDCASPIVVEGRHIANLCIGQFFLEPPDMDFFRQQQEKFGFDKESYFKALAEVPIVAEEKIPAILNLLSGLAHQIAKQSLAEKKALTAYASVEQQVVERTQELQASHELLRKLSEQVPGVIYQFRLFPDGTSCFPYASEGIQDIFEISPAQVEETADAAFSRVHPDDLEHVRAVIQHSAETLSPWHDEYRVVLPNQGVRWREGNATPERLPDGSTLWHGFITDITSRKEHEHQLEHVAHYDSLTDLPNRTLLADRLQQAMTQSLRHEHSLAVVYLDLDGFKTVNDTYGHDVGDNLLVIVAKRMKDALRDGDSLARIGGDEFIAILADLEQPEDVEHVLARLLMAAAEPVTVNENVMQVSASIGVTLYPQDMVDADQLVRHADQAMYIAKQAGKNRFHLFNVSNEHKFS